MPEKSYFRGHGEKVMAAMRKTYGSEKKAKQVFFATANKKHMNPEDPGMKALSRKK